MITSQWVMLTALICMLATWAVWGMTGCRSRVGHQRLGLISIQTLGAIGLSFSSENIFLSLVLSAVILAAVIWMIRESAPSHQ